MRLQDHGTQEVLGAQVRRVHPDVDDAADVLPQRLPLLLLSPDIRALEQRDEKVRGRLNNSSGVLLKVSTSRQIPSDASGAAVGWWAVALLHAWVT